jgi:dTDP-4-amino-4,6-dideoxygalactose transaminase
MIKFNKPYLTGNEIPNILDAHRLNQFSGDGEYTKRCHRYLEKTFHCEKALLTHSGTAALEMSAILADLIPGDEVIMPSYTFVSTANAFVLRGAVPVFIDIREDTLNMDETKIEEAIGERTKAIVPVHYAGFGCEMDEILRVAKNHGLLVVEDAAHGFMAKYRGRYLGTIGDLGVFSFHETKNVISGEGGSLLVNAERFAERAEIIREKGTDRSKFVRGEVDKYTWVDIGSSYLPGEIIAAFLFAQFEQAAEITSNRLAIWKRYHELLEPLELAGNLRRPIIPDGCEGNGHMYYILLENEERRDSLIEFLKRDGIKAVFHFVPLHSSPAGRRYGNTKRDLITTESIAKRIVRLPLFNELTDENISGIVETIRKFF